MPSTTHLEFDKATQAPSVSAAFADHIRSRTILITGVNRLGIGFATAQAFAQQGPANLVLAGRSEEKLQDCIKCLQAEYPRVNIRPLIVDLGSKDSVRAAAKIVLEWADIPTIDIVINNAGLMRHGANGYLQTTADGIEDMFATNHLGHFLLTNLIMPKILSAGRIAEPGATRIVNLSSSGTWVSPFRPSDIQWEKVARDIPDNERPNFKLLKMSGMSIDENTATYIPTAAYGQSKTCAVLFSWELNKRLFEKHNILSLSVNPGEVRTELSRNTDPDWLAAAIKRREELGLMYWKTQAGGASTSLVAACDPQLIPINVFLQDCQVATPPPWAVDEIAAGKLWILSEELIGEKFEY